MCPEGEEIEPSQEFLRTDANYTAFDECAKSSQVANSDCHALCSYELERKYAGRRVQLKSCHRVDGDSDPNVSVSVEVDAMVYPVCYGY